MGWLDPLRLGEHVHGHLGWATAAALLHPAVLLRRSGRRAHLSVGLATLLATVTGALGVALYTPYRESLRPSIYASARAMGGLFERKEHLAFGAIVLAWAGALAYAGACAASDPHRASLQRAARWAFVAAAAMAILAAAFGTVVASYKTF